MGVLVAMQPTCRVSQITVGYCAGFSAQSKAMQRRRGLLECKLETWVACLCYFESLPLAVLDAAFGDWRGAQVGVGCMHGGSDVMTFRICIR